MTTVEVRLPPDLEPMRQDFERNADRVKEILNSKNGYSSKTMRITIADEMRLVGPGAECVSGLRTQQYWWVTVWLRPAGAIHTCHSRGPMAAKGWGGALGWETSHLWACSNGLQCDDRDLKDETANEIYREIDELEWDGPAVSFDRVDAPVASWITPGDNSVSITRAWEPESLLVQLEWTTEKPWNKFSISRYVHPSQKPDKTVRVVGNVFSEKPPHENCYYSVDLAP
jgi:hypothetical protein